MDTITLLYNLFILYLYIPSNYDFVSVTPIIIINTNNCYQLKKFTLNKELPQV